MLVFDKFKEEFIDESSIEPIAPPERYIRMEERDYHLKDIIIFKDDIYVGHGLLDEKRHLIFSGYITCEMAIRMGYEWTSGKE